MERRLSKERKLMQEDEGKYPNEEKTEILIAMAKLKCCRCTSIVPQYNL